MLVIHFGFVVLMAQNALEHFIVRGVHMAGRAGLPLAAMLAGIDAKVLAVVVERRGQPRIQRVARRAIVREIQRHVIRIRRPLEIGLMAGIAIRGRARKTIVHVALIASGREVRAQ